MLGSSGFLASIVCSGNLGDQVLTTVMIFLVNVPVLSEQTIDTLPRVSIAGSRLIKAFCLLILCTAIDRMIDTTANNVSGIEATANETDTLSELDQPLM